jgi:hypothetical protein
VKRIVSCLFALLTGCSSFSVVPVSPDAVPLDPRAARVCVYRASTIGWALTVPVRDNGLAVGATSGRGYFCYNAALGRHLVQVDVSDADPFVLEVHEARRYDLELIINMGQDRLVAIDAVRGDSLAAELDYVVIAEAPSGEQPLAHGELAPSAVSP